MTTTMTPTYGWWRDAACFGDTRFQAADKTVTETQREEMRTVCGTCPARRDCLIDALNHDERGTMRGGLTGRERRNPKHIQQALGTAPAQEKRPKKRQRSWTAAEDDLIRGTGPRDDKLNAHQLDRTVAAVQQRRVRLARLAYLERATAQGSAA